MKLRTFLETHQISLRKLSEISGVPYVTLKKNVDSKFMESQQDEIREGLRGYFSDGLSDVDKITF